MLHEICVILIISLSLKTRADIFTAMVEVEQLLKTYQIITDKLDEYIEKEEKRLSILKRFEFSEYLLR